MTKANQQCQPPERMLDFLRGGLTSSEEESLQLHLDVCLACRQLLSSSAADEAAWDEAHQFFSSEAQDNALCIGEAQPLEAHGTNGEQFEEPESIESLLKLLGPTDDPRMLGRIGSYEIVGVLGRGGMGVVFKAYEPSLNRYVAIKLLLPHLAASGAARMRFAREGRAAAAVIDDNVLPIFSVSEWQGIPYLVTQLSRGSNLQKRINETGPLELREILRLGMQTASGLAAAHAQGLVHRDIKPSNILLDGTVDRALLTDFGLARAVDDASITCSGIIAGTPQYMSPEQACGGAVDARSDLFGLGSVLYTMCTGRPPFRAENSFAVLRLITDVHPRSIREINPDIPEWLCVIIAKLMSKSPEERYQSAAEVAELLSACLAHVQQPTVVDIPSELREQLDRHRIANGSSKNWRITLAHYITYRMPYWLPCFLTTLIAFTVSLGPAMTLPTLPKEIFLHSIPPSLAILFVTAIGFAWGLAITVSAKRVVNETDTTEQPKKRHPFALSVIGGVIVASAIFIPWFMRQSRLTQELVDTKKQLLGATAGNGSVISSAEPTEPAAHPTLAATADERPLQIGIAEDAQQTGQIIGFLRSDLGEPVRNATIACSCVYDKTGKGGGANAITDAKGLYQFSGLTEGIYSIWLKHYENPHFTAIADDGIEVTANQPAASSLVLVPTIHVTGLLTQEGKPATTGTPVHCFCSSRPESSAAALTALTDDQGRFAFDLPYGRASFFAMRPSQDTNVPLVAKAQLMVGQAKEAAKESFGDVHLELQARKSEFGSTDWLDRAPPGTEVVERKYAEDITGTIVDTQGNPIESAMVFTEADLQPVESDKNGFFRFPKAKGTQTIMRVFRQDYHIWMGMPTAGDRLKIVLEAKESQLGLTSDNGGMSSKEVVVPQNDTSSPPNSLSIPFVEIADLHPGLDKHVVEMAFVIKEEYMISGGVPVGNDALFRIEPQLKSGDPKLSVLVSGDCADALSRSGLGPDLNQAYGVGIQATGQLVVVPPPKDRPDEQPNYQLRISDWKKCRVSRHGHPMEFGPTIGPEIGPADSVVRPPVSCVLLELNKPGTVEVEVSVGFEDGIRPGDKLNAIHEGQIVGKVEIIRAEASRSSARIIEVVPGKALDRGAKVESSKRTQAEPSYSSLVDLGIRPTVPIFEVPFGASNIKESDEKERSEPISNTGNEPPLSLRPVNVDGECLIELTRGNNKQTTLRFTMQTDAGRIEVTPSGDGLMKIVRGKVEMFVGELTLRAGSKPLQISASAN